MMRLALGEPALERGVGRLLLLEPRRELADGLAQDLEPVVDLVQQSRVVLIDLRLELRADALEQLLHGVVARRVGHLRALFFKQRARRKESEKARFGDLVEADLRQGYPRYLLRKNSD